MKEKLKQFYDKVHTEIQVVWYGVQNLIAFAPIVWKDRYWDHAFLLDLMEFKLRQMAWYHQKYGHTLNADKKALEMIEAAGICNRLRREEYGEDRYDQHDEKWGRIKLPKFRDEQGRRITLTINRENVRTPESKEQESKEFEDIFQFEQLAQQRDLDRLAELFRTRLLGWWD